MNSDGSYNQGSTAGELAAVWRVQRLGQAEYLLEVRLPKEDPRYGLLLFFEHYPGYLRFFGGVSDSMVREAASKTGLNLGTVNKMPSITQGQSKELILATLQEIKSRHDPKNLIFYVRQGGFVEPGGETNSFSTMLPLLQRGDTAAVVEMGRYLSDRGDIQAQRTLMSLASAGVLDRAEGIRHGRRAIQSAPTGDEIELANLYLQSAESEMPVSEDDAKEALLLLATAQLNKPTTNVEPQIKKLSQVVCGRQDSTTMKRCMETQASYWKMRAAATRQMQQMAAEVIEAELAQARTMARQRALQEEVNDAEAEKKKLQAEREALETELCGRPGCAARK